MRRSAGEAYIRPWHRSVSQTRLEAPFLVTATTSSSVRLAADRRLTKPPDLPLSEQDAIRSRVHLRTGPRLESDRAALARPSSKGCECPGRTAAAAPLHRP